ncbi:Glucose-1-phosphate adenylyltransferase [Pseudobythopirellula maris]|uniref:Glucose-1-phosphate adenylyltransferase n=1 Tax=Pseudobythopirellula maris TaxID=2527991 RepID=A0A5C5ZMW9_9BACT|nr:glucose-1-phosphate adenylyltransferase [Pseudobythopirellula maris]TWT88508.1 Glucose-1-phosphate adenylyltransferase [Pseudobythopirellula maris]
MKNVVAVVLGGGRGTRLMPLTGYRSKPAVPLAGKYRLIDIPISNCINSGCHHVYVLTQFLSVSLHQHIRRAYRFDAYSGGFVEVLAAQQTMADDANLDWYQGTADAVRKNLLYMLEEGFEHVLILSGDQLYRMDYQKMLDDHLRSNADVTIAAKPVHRHEASGLGVMKADDSGRVIGFVEKPQSDAEIDPVAMDPRWIDARGIASEGRECLASMGIYLWNRQALIDALESNSDSDFGREIFPNTIANRHVQMHVFDGYWEDIGTIRSFYEANLQMAQAAPPFPLATASSPIYTRARFLPPTRVDGAEITGSLVADGCEIEPGAKIENSVIGLRCRIGRNVTIRNSVVMGADYYEQPPRPMCGLEGEQPAVGIGDGAVIDGAILDKNCCVGAGARVLNETGQDDFEGNEGCAVRDGILVVPKNAVLAPGWRLTPN